LRKSDSLFLEIRGLRYHVRHWPKAGAPKMVLLHGWMDVSASFQFLVDALRRDWDVYAPDWRGYGLTAWSGSDNYWFPDYIGDLDALLERIQPGAPINLVGHSLGGNVGGLYAGIRPALHGARSRTLCRRARPATAGPIRCSRQLGGEGSGA